VSDQGRAYLVRVWPGFSQNMGDTERRLRRGEVTAKGIGFEEPKLNYGRPGRTTPTHRSLRPDPTSLSRFSLPFRSAA
jgi:hypothetical protein